MVCLSECGREASIMCRPWHARDSRAMGGIKTVKVKCTLRHWGKVKCTLVQALRLCTGRTDYRGSSGITLPFLDRGTRRGEGSESRPGRSLPPEKTRYPLYRRLGGLQGRSEQVRKISPPPGFYPRTVQPGASHCTNWATRPTIRGMLVNI